VISVRVSSVSFVVINWVRSINISGSYLSVHSVEFGIGNGLEWGGSSVHHVDSRGRVVPFLFVSLSNIIGVVLGDHSVMFLLCFLLSSNFISRSISGVLPSSSGFIRGRLLGIHGIKLGISDSFEWGSSSVLHVDL
jgi:hypothetical protein